MRKLLYDYLKTPVGKYQFFVIALDIYFELTGQKPKVHVPMTLIEYYLKNNAVILSNDLVSESLKFQNEPASEQISQ